MRQDERIPRRYFRKWSALRRGRESSLWRGSAVGRSNAARTFALQVLSHTERKQPPRCPNATPAGERLGHVPEIFNPPPTPPREGGGHRIAVS